jgi:methylglutaconyl-CoA hydratase
MLGPNEVIVGQKFSTIAVQRTGPTARLILSRPDKRNAFDGTMVTELRAALRQAREESAVRAIVISGADDCFCAGVDLEWFAKGSKAPSDQVLSESLELAALFREIYTCAKPVIAAIDGAAMGGGIGFVAAADIAVATERARFSLSATKIGVVPTCVAPYVIRRCGGGRCRELMLTSEVIEARQALAIGLVHRVVPDAELGAAVEAVIGHLAQGGPEAVALIKRMVAELTDQQLDRASRVSAEMLARLRRGEEAAAGIKAFLQKRSPAWWPRPE